MARRWPFVSATEDQGAAVDLGTGRRRAPTGESATVAGALIGRIGTGDFFHLGFTQLLTAWTSGEIGLAVNDIQSFFFDNLGEFTAKVCVAR